jgi:hypothetical protein
MVGFQAGWTATSANKTTTGTRQTLIGFNTGASVTTQLNDIVCVGDTAQVGGGTSVAVGSGAWAYSSCVSIGYQAGLSTATGTDNTFIGYQAGHALTGSVFYVNNTFLGYSAGSGSTTGLNTTLIGASSGTNMVGGSNCTHVGVNSGQAVASSSFSNTTSLGYGTTVGAAGGVAIGTDNANSGATTSTANTIQLGTSLHTLQTSGKVKIDARGTTSGALSTMTFVSGTGKQVDTTCDRFLVLNVAITLATDTVAIALSPDNTTYSTFGTYTPGVVNSSDQFGFPVPASWYVKVTLTGSAAITTATYY